MRQRTISDFFWRDPTLADLSQEDKSTVLYALTSPSSNLTGVYRIVPRIAAAEMGWTAEQLSLVLVRLDGRQILRYDAVSGWLWVRIWWQHNQLALALSPKLRAKAIRELADMPPAWREEYLGELAARGYSVDTLSIGYPYCTDTAPGNVALSLSGNVAAARDVPPAGKYRRERPSGIVTWSAEDVAEAQRIEHAFELPAIAEAVASVCRSGKDAVPGLVARALKRPRRKHEVSPARRQDPPTDETATARGLALLPPALQAHVVARRHANQK